MIYDCFLFNDEVEILEIRFNELDRFVDRFIVVTSQETHSGEYRRPVLKSLLETRYKRWEKKIHIFTLPVLYGDNPRERQAFQRDAAVAMFRGCLSKDWVIFSDVDEIPRGNKIREFNPSMGAAIFSQNFFLYYLNGFVSTNGWNASIVATVGFLRKEADGSFERLRLMTHPTFGHPEWFQHLQDGGWHFSFVGGPERIAKKIFDLGLDTVGPFDDMSRLQNLMDRGLDVLGRCDSPIVRYVPVDETYPAHVYENQDRYKEFIHAA